MRDEAGLAGWVADLDRETRGFVRTPEWTHWIRARGAEVFTLRSRGLEFFDTARKNKPVRFEKCSRDGMRMVVVFVDATEDFVVAIFGDTLAGDCLCQPHEPFLVHLGMNNQRTRVLADLVSE